MIVLMPFVLDGLSKHINLIFGWTVKSSFHCISIRTEFGEGNE